MLAAEVQVTHFYGAGQNPGIKKYFCQINKMLHDNLSVVILNIWWPMPLFLNFYFTGRYWDEYIYMQYFAWGLHGDVDVRWSGGLLD